MADIDDVGDVEFDTSAGGTVPAAATTILPAGATVPLAPGVDGVGNVELGVTSAPSETPSLLPPAPNAPTPS